MVTIVSNVDCAAQLPAATTQAGACAAGTYSRDGTDVAGSCLAMSTSSCPPGFGFSSKFRLCVEALDPSALPKRANLDFQKKSWYVGCLVAAKLASQAACEATCRGAPLGCCTGTNRFQGIMPPLLGLEDLVCHARSCSGWGCCEASGHICALACAAYFNSAPSFADSQVNVGAVADDGFCTVCPEGKTKCTADAGACLSGNCTREPGSDDNSTTFYLTGLVGSATASTPHFRIHGPSAAIFGNSSAWDQESGTLTLRVAAGEAVRAGNPIILMLPITNPDAGQLSPWQFTYASGQCARPTFAYGARSLALPARYVQVDLEHRLGEAASEAGDKAPLLVRWPAFVVRRISQSNPAAGPALGPNLISLNLVANFDLDLSSSLTIRGLVPTATPSSPRTLLVGGYSSSSVGSGLYDFYGDTWTSNDRGETWLRVSNASSSSWQPREGFALAVVNASVFLAGGWGGPALGYLRDVWRSQDGGASWMLASSAPPWPARGYFEMVCCLHCGASVSLRAVSAARRLS